MYEALAHFAILVTEKKLSSKNYTKMFNSF